MRCNYKIFWTLHVMHAYQLDCMHSKWSLQCTGMWALECCFLWCVLLNPCWARHYVLTQQYKMAFQGSHLQLARLVLHIRWMYEDEYSSGWLMHTLKVQLLQQSAHWLCFILMHAMLHHRCNIHKVSHTSISSTKALSCWFRPHQYHMHNACHLQSSSYCWAIWG